MVGGPHAIEDARGVAAGRDGFRFFALDAMRTFSFG
jgi:hypothetical protein